MRQAIRTRYLGPTNTLGAKIKASCAAGNICTPYNDAFTPETNHEGAAYNLMEKLGWDKFNRIEGGWFKDEGYFVQIPKQKKSKRRES